MTYILPTTAVLATVIEDVNLVAVTGRTTASWATGAYRKVTIDFAGIVSAGTPATGQIWVRFNNDTGLNYQFIGSATSTSTTLSGDIVGNITYVPVGFFNNTSQSDVGFSASINVKKNGFNRVGRSESVAMRNGVVLAGSQKFESAFMWANTATEVTFLTLGMETNSTMTGRLVVVGYP